MKTYSVPDEEDKKEFLIRLYFGFNSNDLRLCINRAYLDFSRTLHRFSKLPNANDLREAGKKHVEARFTKLKNVKISDQTQFDDWHREACESLCKLYDKKGYSDFHIGQAQKWLNMTFKYIQIMGEERIPGYAKFLKYGHAPIDNIIIKKFRKHKAPSFDSRWSRISSYDDYLKYQRWIRKTFSGSESLAVEFSEWLERDNYE